MLLNRETPRLLRMLPWALAGYWSLLWLLRTWGVAGGSVDDAEMLLYSQSWRWAYSPDNPPGPVWLVYLLQKLIGPQLAAVTTLKFLWLAVAQFALLASARRLLPPALAVCATLALGGVAYVVWESVLNYSHSAQLLAACLLTLYQCLRVRETRAARDYLLLGFALLLGLLSKFNFLFFVLPLLLATWRVPVWRAVLLDRRLGWTLLPPALCLPILIAQHVELAALPPLLMQKFEPAPDWSFAGALSALWASLKAWLSWLSPWAVFALLLLPECLKTPHGDSPVLADERWLRWLCLGMLVLLTAAVVLGRVTHMRTHYWQIASPVLLWVVLRAELAGAAHRRQWLLAAGSALFALLSPLMLALDLGGLVALNEKPRLQVPYRKVATQLIATGFSGGTVVAVDWPHALSGNLRPWLPEVHFISQSHPTYLPPAPRAHEHGQCLFLWSSAGEDDASALRTFAVERLGLEVSATPQAAGEFAVKLSDGSGRELTLHWQRYAGAGRCR